MQLPRDEMGKMDQSFCIGRHVKESPQQTLRDKNDGTSRKYRYLFQKTIESSSQKPNMMNIKRLSNISAVLHVRSIFILKLNCANTGTMIRAVMHLLAQIVEVGFHWSIVFIGQTKSLFDPF